ncbi:hypothetical protein AOLI_G00202700 [Acnodon oligacanthus]
MPCNKCSDRATVVSDPTRVNVAKSVRLGVTASSFPFLSAVEQDRLTLMGGLGIWALPILLGASFWQAYEGRGSVETVNSTEEAPEGLREVQNIATEKKDNQQDARHAYANGNKAKCGKAVALVGLSHAS